MVVVAVRELPFLVTSVICVRIRGRGSEVTTTPYQILSGYDYKFLNAGIDKSYRQCGWRCGRYTVCMIGCNAKEENNHRLSHQRCGQTTGNVQNVTFIGFLRVQWVHFWGCCSVTWWWKKSFFSSVVEGGGWNRRRVTLFKRMSSVVSVWFSSVRDGIGTLRTFANHSVSQKFLQCLIVWLSDWLTVWLSG